MRSNRFNLFPGAVVLLRLTAGFIGGQITPRDNDRVLTEHSLPPMDGARPWRPIWTLGRHSRLGPLPAVY